MREIITQKKVRNLNAMLKSVMSFLAEPEENGEEKGEEGMLKELRKIIRQKEVSFVCFFLLALLCNVYFAFADVDPGSGE